MEHSLKKILIVTGETSGDHHGARVIKELRKLHPAISVCGIGGNELEKTGTELLYHSRYLSVIGIIEVLASASHIFKAFQAVKKQIKTAPPDLLILIDYPDFNLRIASIAHKKKVPVLYYISPQIWAWRRGRAKKIARIVDNMAVIFPFETKFYEEVGLPVRFVGHPLLDREVKPQNPPKEIIAIKQSSGNPVIGLLPGSRKGEIKKLLPIMLKAADIIKKKLPSAQFIIPLAPGIERDFINPMLAQTEIDSRMTTDCFYETLEACDMAIVASGTATLETAVMLKPMVIIYKVSLMTYLIGKMLIRVPFIGLANLVAGKKVVPELIQNDATPEKIAAETTAILNDPHRLEEIKTDLAAVKKSLGEKGASKEVASQAYEMIK